MPHVGPTQCLPLYKFLRLGILSKPRPHFSGHMAFLLEFELATGCLLYHIDTILNFVQTNPTENLWMGADNPTV